MSLVGVKEQVGVSQVGGIKGWQGYSWQRECSSSFITYEIANKQTGLSQRIVSVSGAGGQAREVSML